MDTLTHAIGQLKSTLTSIRSLLPTPKLRVPGQGNGPLSHVPGWVIGVGAVGLSIAVVKVLSRGCNRNNPFANFTRSPSLPYVADPSARDAVLKQGFSEEYSKQHWDAVVIGSGIGGLTAAALLAKVGQRVLVLEQHDQAGGCCHTFVEDGFEFDTGIHYIGEMQPTSSSRVLFDVMTDNQLDWVPLDNTYDLALIKNEDNEQTGNCADGSGNLFRTYEICAFRDKFRALLVSRFPNEAVAIDKYFSFLAQVRKTFLLYFMLKAIPLPIAKFIVRSGLLKWTPYYKWSTLTLDEVLDNISCSNELKAVLTYNFGDYGVVPSEVPFLLHAVLANHYLHGAFYPSGGPSEIPYQIIKVIEAAGGKVAVRAAVKSILLDESGSRAIGVQLERGHTIYADKIISGAGAHNTFNSMLPESISEKYGFSKFLESNTRPGLGGFSVFVGLKGDAKELNLPPQNAWILTGNKLSDITTDYLNSDGPETNPSCTPPIVFVSFPSSKDPTWDARYPGKSVCLLITVANFDWFERWERTRINQRGEEYNAVKKILADRAWELTCSAFPQLKDRVEHFSVGTPLTNKFYLRTENGAMYGLDHDLQRFSGETAIGLRPETPIKGLFLTGQDVATCGLAGAMFGGLLCVSKILNRNLFNDLTALRLQEQRRIGRKVRE